MSENIRKALPADLPVILEVDRSRNLDREKFLHQAIESGGCYVFDHNSIIGYITLDYSFFSQGFIALCVVQDHMRGRGIGTQLFKHVETACEKKKLFSSTNESNALMRKLFLKLGYKESGKVEDLDMGDPEIFYFKSLG